MPTGVPSTNHIGFTVSAIARPRAMFEELFGYQLESLGGRDPRGVARLTGVPGADIEVAHLRHPRLIGIELIAYAAPMERGRLGGRPCDLGYTHLTYDVGSIEMLLPIAARHGLVPLGEVVGRPGSKRVVYLRDPDGIAIELIEAGLAA
jgi:catechol 2,3-dioxygenase-like lactoylglutathione lyase family enzyme